MRPQQFSSPLFLAKVTADLTGGLYSFQEQWLVAGAVADRLGGRYGNSSSPGVAVGGATYAVGDLVLVRQADGEAGLKWEILTAVPAASGAAGVTVEEADGSPSYAACTTLRFDQADGFVLSQPAAGVARVDLAPATTTQAGGVTTGAQIWAGDKSTTGQLCALSGTSPLILGAFVCADGGTYAGVHASGLILYFNPSNNRVILGAQKYSIVSGPSTVADGQTGTVGPGATVTGGIVTHLGSGTYLADPGDGVPAGTYP